MITQQYTYYVWLDDDNVIRESGICPTDSIGNYPDIPHNGWRYLRHNIPELITGQRYYVDAEDNILPRPTFSEVFDQTTIHPDEVATLLNVPTNALIKVTGPINAEVTHPGGDFTFETPELGTFTIVIEAFPYLPATYTIEVVP